MIRRPNQAMSPVESRAIAGAPLIPSFPPAWCFFVLFTRVIVTILAHRLMTIALHRVFHYPHFLVNLLRLLVHVWHVMIAAVVRGVASVQELQVVREERAVAVIVIVESFATFLARGVPRKMGHINVVAQTALLLILANVLTHALPLGTHVLALAEVHVPKVCDILAVGVHAAFSFSAPIASRTWTWTWCCCF